MEMNKYMLFLCIERVLGLINGWRNLEIFFAYCRSNTMIPVHSREEVGQYLK
jgi:hypothetical protein